MANKDTEFIEYVSKSEIKREMHELQKLGEKLLKLPASQLKNIQMPEELLDAIIEAQKTGSFIAGRRHQQYIGALMRNADPAPIREALDKLARGIALVDKNVEDDPTIILMNRLLTGGKKAFGELIDKYPELDRQHTNQLIRLASKEKKDGKKERQRRILLRYLKELEQE